MRIIELRKENGFTQDYVATQLNIRQNTYSQYENGQRQLPVSVIIALSKLYRVTTDYILELNDIG